MVRPISLRLVTLSRAGLTQLVSEPDDFARAHALQLGPVRDVTIETAQQSADFYDRARIEPPWASFLALADEDGQVVGTCSFTGAPNDNGEVEIAYFTFPLYEGHGVASAMAAQLVALAVNSKDVECVIAHTLREENASVRILRGLGFRHAGEVIDDPADGPVWRWELPLFSQ